MLEAIELCEEIAGRELDWTLGDEPRMGDHRWWISDLDEFRRDYPDWEPRHDLRATVTRDPRPERRALAGGGLKLSVVMPARDEEGTVESTVREIVATLDGARIEHEVLVVDDHSRDHTFEIVRRLSGELHQVRCIPSPYSGGFGLTVRAGLEQFEGDAVTIMMADRSDNPRDLVRYHRLLSQGYDCAFGSRFVPGAELHDYPRIKLFINRAVNLGIRVLFRHPTTTRRTPSRPTVAR